MSVGPANSLGAQASLPNNITLELAQLISGLIQPVTDPVTEIREFFPEEMSKGDQVLMAILLQDLNKARDFIVQQRYARIVTRKNDGILYVVTHTRVRIHEDREYHSTEMEQLPMKWYLNYLTDKIRLVESFFNPTEMNKPSCY